MKKIPFLLFLCLTSVIYAQVSFEKGYIIDNSGKRSEVFIKNSDWGNNPSEIYYKNNIEDTEIQNGTLTNLKEFGIGEFVKYQRSSVGIDQSPSSVDKLSWEKEPEFINDTVFLKQLVEGDADLFVYQDNRILAFYYSKNESEVIPLVYKKYKTSNTTVATNSSYKKELFDALKCQSINVDDTRKLDYDRKELVALFTKYNMCTSNVSLSYSNQSSKGAFHVSAKIGYFSMGLDVKQEGTGIINTDIRSVDLGTKSGIRIAAELEYVLPFNKNKWAVFLEPGYQSFSAETQLEVESQIPSFMESLNVEYSYIDVPFGVRHYMYLSENSSIFLNAAFVFAFDFGGTFNYTNDTLNQRDPSINSSANLLFGLGYKYNQKFGIEARINTARNITRDEAFLNSAFSSAGVILSYTFL